MTSAKFSDYWTPSSLSLFPSRNLSVLSSRFDQHPPSPSMRTSFKIGPSQKSGCYPNDPTTPQLSIIPLKRGAGDWNGKEKLMSLFTI